MFYKFNRLFDERSIGQFFKRLGLVISSIVAFLTYLAGAENINAHLISKNIGKGYILLSTSIFNNILFMLVPAIIVIFIIAYFAISYFFNGSVRPVVSHSVISRGGYKKAKNTIGYNITFFILIAGSILLYIYSINNFYGLFDNKIEKHNLLTIQEYEKLFE